MIGNIRQQERRSRRFFLLQVCQDLLDDHRVFDAGNDLRCSSANSALLNVDMENTLEPLRPGHRDMTLDRGLLAWLIGRLKR